MSKEMGSRYRGRELINIHDKTSKIILSSKPKPCPSSMGDFRAADFVLVGCE